MHIVTLIHDSYHIHRETNEYEAEGGSLSPMEEMAQSPPQGAQGVVCREGLGELCNCPACSTVPELEWGGDYGLSSWGVVERDRRKERKAEGLSVEKRSGPLFS